LGIYLSPPRGYLIFNIFQTKRQEDKFVKANFSKTIEIMSRTLKINITSEVDVANHMVVLNLLKEVKIKKKKSDQSTSLRMGILIFS
jgi:hypothetical protein